MLTITELYKAYGAPVISGFSYTFPPKGLVVIRGASGSGKTTLLRLIAGLEKPDSGRIETDCKRISFVFQEARLVPNLTVLDNVLLVKKEKDKKEALAILDRLGLGEARKKYPHQLSGGMKLRVAIARSVYFGGELYLWDEPTKELDPENCRIIRDLMKEVSGKALFLTVTHDPEIVGDMVIRL